MKLRKIKTNKKAAFELSVSTMIVIVLAVVFLILALTLLRRIFGGATESIDKIDAQVMKEIEKMFTDENKKIIVYLGEEKTANIRAGTQGFSFWLAAKTLYGNAVGNWSGIQYKLELDKNSECYKKLGASQIEKWFITQKLSTTTEIYNDISEYEGDTAYAKIQLTIPEATTLCSQDVKVSFIDNTQEEKKLPIGGLTFTIRILRKAIF